ncbi:isochorismate synthase [Pseudomonas sp. FW306-02-F02-AA]|uniref:isochorismate synthase n=1 Tax=Pseudomonas fluorescens TaxID=294 RepID=A0A0N9X096_PSEFL|nr:MULTISPECIES: isochorismate synthase MenF [Pseudomonas]ALI03981.1 isochorismate synthase [Pseudomonas fluorescens]PMZ04908.1 isochorismate synthase [Pseudomonas sp. FW306-02-F02-AB]PMZ12073.1 isochorismate synthase [Pseudomonas sp. FW306-02-H06C]PMZ17833.1 isochorismate synthase [Pseudomonas sp. FW306-02-F02-AA]PMZ23865.1 isochorismate synthase [Pseudomonas sp. FW306-02-F08-AA]
MRSGTLRANDTDEVQAIDEKESFSFTSGDRELTVAGMLQRIETPAIGGENANSLFQKTVMQALDRARKAGQSNPIIVGAIPFDPAEASCLYIPEHAEWRTRSATVQTDVAALPELIEQKNIPDEQGFKRAVEHAIVNFRHSDVRKAVLSVQRELVFAQDVDVGAMQNNLRAQNQSGYHFRVPMPDGATLIGVSPELLVHKDGLNFVSNPLAGSAKRMSDPQADRRNADWLSASEKDHYEHRLVTEDIATQLGELCTQLDVPQRPSLISTPALWHLSTRIEGTLADPTVSALQLACRLHPTPAVCGFPTERARRLIRFVEPFERGLFTGMVGWCDAQGNGEWVVTIRCGTVKRNRVRLFAGAGIVEASSPDSEWTEVQTKLGTMLRACGLAH